MTRYLKISGRVSCLAVILWLLLMPRTGLAQPWYRVTGVYDGDTIVLEDGRCVRYIGINTPETAHPPKVAEPFGNEARKANQALVYRKRCALNSTMSVLTVMAAIWPMFFWKTIPLSICRSSRKASPTACHGIRI